jgi:hypothetical protein
MPEVRGDSPAGNDFDQVIDSLLKRLERDPEKIDLHRQLREVGLQRTAAGGKPAGGFLGPALPFAGKGPKEKMLNAEFVLAHDVGNIPAMMDLYRAAESASYVDVAEWIGQILRAATLHIAP